MQYGPVRSVIEESAQLTSIIPITNPLGHRHVKPQNHVKMADHGGDPVA